MRSPDYDEWASRIFWESLNRGGELQQPATSVLTSAKKGGRETRLARFLRVIELGHLVDPLHAPRMIQG